MPFIGTLSLLDSSLLGSEAFQFVQPDSVQIEWHSATNEQDASMIMSAGESWIGTFIPSLLDRIE